LTFGHGAGHRAATLTDSRHVRTCIEQELHGLDLPARGGDFEGQPAEPCEQRGAQHERQGDDESAAMAQNTEFETRS